MVFFQIIILLLLLIVIGPMAAAAAGLGVEESEQDDDKCLPTRCSKHHGPEIRFPFWLKDKQPERCGYPGFNLSCIVSHSKYPVLELPNYVCVIVKKIDYKSQTIHVSDPHRCFPQQLQNLNLSVTPFQFIINLDCYYYYNFSFINCSSTQPDFYYGYRIACLSDQSHQVYATMSSNKPELSCTKMYSMSLPVRTYIYFAFNNLGLKWTKPMCENCEAQGKYCRLNGSSSTECFDKPPSTGEVLGPFVFVIIIYLVYRSYTINKEDQAKIEKFLEDYKALKPTRYSYAVIKKITNQFQDKVGQGGYGIVYKGKLSNDVNVAVKILNHVKGNGEEFINEVQTMGRIHHINVVRLVGYCADGFRRALIYEFLPNNSLEKFISSNQEKRSLGWEKLQDIALGIAKGIEYLHSGCDQRILHFDIKPHNILLDNKFNPKISDFGLAKLCSKEQSAISMTAARGTVGYIAPEMFSKNFGNVSYKSDIYSFGMLLLDMVGGRQNNITQNTSECYFPEWIYKRLDQGRDLGIQIEEDGDVKIVRKLAIVGLWCIQWYPVDRPSMKVVVQMLEGDGDTLTVPFSPFASTNPMPGREKMVGRTFNSKLEIISESE